MIKAFSCGYYKVTTMEKHIIKKHLLTLIILFITISFIELSAISIISKSDSSSTEENVLLIIKYAQGGFVDSRSPIGKLGGGQFGVGVKLKSFPIGISITQEAYTNSPDPTNTYEISGLIIVNFYYMTKLFNTDWINLYVGGGVGALEVPKGEYYPDEFEMGAVYDIEAGINLIAFWKVGFYGVYKYLYSQKEINNEKVIDFNEHILMLGITLNFSF